MNHYLDIIMFPIQIIVGIFTIYYTVIALFGMWHRKETNLAAPKSRFAIVIPAHNEAMVLGDLLDNLRILKYPKELYDVFVIADNCTDNTADIARAHGAHVFERENKELVGKGYAMDWVFPKIFALDKKYDAFCVFDSDNLVHLDFLAVMNNRLINRIQIKQVQRLRYLRHRLLDHQPPLASRQVQYGPLLLSWRHRHVHCFRYRQEIRLGL